MVIIVVPLIVCILGLIIWLAAKSNAQVQEIGRWMFIVGLFWTVGDLATASVHLFH